MGIFEGCLLASDIDGTLIKNGIINPKNVEKIGWFIDEGGHFALSTGRSVGAVDPVFAEIAKINADVLEKIKQSSPFVTANGCMIYDYANENVLYESLLPREDYRIADIVAKSGIDVGIEIHSGTEVITLLRTVECDDHQRYEWLKTRYLSYEEVCLYNWNKVLYICSNETDRAAVRDIIAKEKTSSVFVNATAELYGKKQLYYEQFAEGLSKAAALKMLAETLRIKTGGLFAIGDYYNDSEMIKNADIGAAVADAPDDVKADAGFIACKCEDGAVSDFIDYLAVTYNKRKD